MVFKFFGKLYRSEISLAHILMFLLLSESNYFCTVFFKCNK